MITLVSLLFTWISTAHAASKFEPCRIWMYDFNASAYVCRSKAAPLSTYSSQEVDKLIAKLTARIDALEVRVKKLEGYEE